MKITIIAGARPNFMKIAPIIHAINHAKSSSAALSYRLVHTGQHYDKNMSEQFFDELNIPHPDANLECGGGTQAEQAANIMVKFEQELMQNPTDLVLVVGDVTSTMACSIVAKKMNTAVAHVEGGIRSGDMTMPEEVNRIVTDSIADYFFTTSEFANENLLKSGVPQERIFFVGNTMIDTLLKHEHRFVRPALWQQYGLVEKQYLMLTLHRPSNVDVEEKLIAYLKVVSENIEDYKVVFPVHPRTRKKLYGIDQQFQNIIFVEPLSYLQFNYLVKNAFAVITDSGGITEETTVMGVPCLTLRDNTERPETVTIGTNELVGTDPEKLKSYLYTLFNREWKKGEIPELWDGKTGERIVNTLIQLSDEQSA